jgi:prephenate dehydrogenase
MTVQFTIIGLGQIGTSIGLALAKHTNQVKRVGYDRILDVQNKAKKLGALDAAPFNLHEAINGADVVVLCLPLDQIKETLKQIGPDLRADAVLLDTAPVKTPVAEWFKTYVPAGRHYIGLLPALSPLCLGESGRGPESARADLFARGTMGIVPPVGTPEAAVNLAANFAQMLDAQPLFLEPLEADGMMAMAHLLPQLTAAALLNASAGQAGWLEIRRLAGRPYALSTVAIAEDDLDPLVLEATHNRENLLYGLDMLIGGLTGLREALKTGDVDDLKWRLERATTDRQIWLNDRQKAEWGSTQNDSAPYTVPGVAERLFGIRGPKKQK